MTRYLLGIITPDGEKWFAVRHPSKGGAMRTKDPWQSHPFESVEAIQAWLDSVPAEVETAKGTKIQNGRDWMSGLRFLAVPMTVNRGEPMALATSGMELQEAGRA